MAADHHTSPLTASAIPKWRDQRASEAKARLERYDPLQTVELDPHHRWVFHAPDDVEKRFVLAQLHRENRIGEWEPIGSSVRISLTVVEEAARRLLLARDEVNARLAGAKAQRSLNSRQPSQLTCTAIPA